MHHLYYLYCVVSSGILRSSTHILMRFQLLTNPFITAWLVWHQVSGQFRSYKSSYSPMFYTHFSNDTGRMIVTFTSSTAVGRLGSY